MEYSTPIGAILGNPCCLELSMYGLVLGAVKSRSNSTEIDDDFYNKINFNLYKNENGIKYLKILSSICLIAELQEKLSKRKCERLKNSKQIGLKTTNQANFTEL